MSTDPVEHPNYTAEYVIAAAYILLFCLSFAFCYLYFFLTYAKPKPAPVNTFATNLPPLTPTPHIFPTQQQTASRIFKDDFSDNRHSWTRTTTIFKEEVNDGVLRFESRKEDYYAFTGCSDCPYLEKPFYLQADLSTEEATAEDFGILFNLDYSTDSFHLFQINTEAGKYYLYYHTDDRWLLRSAGEADQIKAFPDANTLGIYADDEVVELYINGNIVESYVQTGFAFYEGDFSFYVANWDFKLLVDNLFIDDMGK